MSNILEINESDFEQKVLVDSSSCLIIVDFWAPWCGPCKQLTPLIEKAVNKAEGKAKLVKINIDENQQIAAQLRIQSIPAVFAFKDGRPVDAFQGVIPENKIIEFIEKNLGENLVKDHSDFYESINKLIDDNLYENAIDALEDFMASNDNEIKAISLYIDCLGHLKKFDDIENFVSSLNQDTKNQQEIKSSLQKVKIIKNNESGPSIESLLDEFNNNPNDVELIEKIADKYFADNKIDEAFEFLIDNYKKNKDKIKSKLINFFEALGNENKKTQEYRKKFSSIFFS